MKPAKKSILALALQGFFTDYLPQQRALSPHTLQSYRDSLKLLLQFAAGRKSDPSQLTVEHLNVERITAFLQSLETTRHNKVSTRNVRLSAIHSFFRSLGGQCPEHLERTQRILSIPMALTVVALLWLVYRQQGNIAGDWALVAVVVISVAAFWMRFRERSDRPVMLAVVLALILGGGAAAIKVDRMSDNAAMAGAGEPFSSEKLASLRASGKPVFVYFTADWCLTCKVNEKSAIDTRVAQDAFKAAGVTVLVGDWTNGDAAITRFLSEHGASGVPLYLYYPKGGGEAQQLPQILTPSLLAGLTSS